MGTTPQAVVTQQQNGLTQAQFEQLMAALSPMVQRNAPPPQQDTTLVHGTEVGGVFRNGPPNTDRASDISQQTIDLITNAVADVSRAGITTATGYTGYDLKVPAATLVPFMTPLLNMLPREGGVGVPVHNWKAITDLFGGNGPQSVIGSVADGGTPSFLSRTVVSLANTFQTIAFQDAVTFQAWWRARQLEGDIRSMIAAQVLFGLKMVEENWLINMSDKLWTPPQMLLSATNSGGTITNAVSSTMYFIVTAVNANGETLGTTMQSIAIPGTTSSITLTIFTVPNAVSYKVYAALASSTPATSAMFPQSATTQFGSSTALNQPANPIQGSFTATMTAPAGTSGTAYSAGPGTNGNTAKVSVDGSGNILTWQGTQSLLINNSAANAGTGAGGLKGQIIVPSAATGYLALADIQALFLAMYQNARADPEYLFISPQDGITLAGLVTNSGNVRVVVDASSPEMQNQLMAGYRVGKILNEVTQRMVTVVSLPYLAQGTIIAASFSFPYPVAGFSQTPFRVITNQEYYGVEYPPTIANPMQWGWGAFVDETLCMEFLGGLGMIQGIVYH